MRKYILIGLMGFLLSACSDFLEEYSQDQFHPQSAMDLNELLIGSGYWDDELRIPELEASSDDVKEYLTGDAGTGNSQRGFFTWQENPWYDEEDEVWSSIYENIGVANSVITQIEEYPSDTLYNRVKGEAYFIRGASYFFLANLYALPYEEATASTTLGVPVKTTEYVEDVPMVRQRLDVVYDVIVSDLREAITNLRGVVQPTIFRANEWAAHALLSRVYLYMGRYEEAIAECDSVLDAHRYSVYSLNGFSTADSCFTAAARPEMIFTQGGYSNVIRAITNQGTIAEVVNYESYGMFPSTELLGLYNRANDYRFDAFFFTREVNTRTGYRACYKTKFDDLYGVSDFGTLRISEVILNKAEALAMLGRDGEVPAALEALLNGRYDENPRLPASGQELVEWIRDERRRELCFEGHRWFDLRRYAVAPQYRSTKEIVHVTYICPNMLQQSMVDPSEVYRLAPFDQDNRKWCFPIPGYETVLSDQMIQNERYESEYENYDETQHEQYL